MVMLDLHKICSESDCTLKTSTLSLGITNMHQVKGLLIIPHNKLLIVIIAKNSYSARQQLYKEPPEAFLATQAPSLLKGTHYSVNQSHSACVSRV